MKFDPNYNPYPSARTVQYAKNGMVAASHPLAAAAGLAVLKKGGNAVDAAIAAAACLTIVEPTSNGIGGDAFAIVHINGEIYGLDASGYAPNEISIEAVKKAGYDKMPVMGWLPVMVPGIPAAWAELSSRFGALSLLDCMLPAVNYAKEGHPVAPIVAKYWQRGYEAYKQRLATEEFTPWFDTFAQKGTPPQAGDIWTSSAHADTLTDIGKTNSKSFYRGELADRIADFSKKTGGLLTKTDLAAYKPAWVTPLCVNYKGYNIWEMPPPGQGLVALIALNILKDYDFNENDPTAYHKAFEAIKLAFAAGKEYITDPEYMNVKPDELLSESYAQSLRNKIGKTAARPAAVSPNSGGTVYLATADGNGNMVSYIQSNYMGFGSGIVIPQTGIAMQNRGADFSLDANHANALAGGKRTYHTIIPGFITKNNNALGPFGVMGGYMQPQGHLQVLINSIDLGLNPQMALDAPRWQWMSDKSFQIEHHFPRHIAAKLADMGHQIHIPLDSGSFGRGQIIWRNPDNGVLCGGTESRCDGSVAVW